MLSIEPFEAAVLPLTLDHHDDPPISHGDQPLAMASPATVRGAGWLLWRHRRVAGLRIDGTLDRALLAGLESALGACHRGDPATGLLVDARYLRAGVGPDHLERVADVVPRMAHAFGSHLQRVALVAPNDWSTPWWHGLAMLATASPTWRTFISWGDAYAWLGGRVPIDPALELVVADTRHPLLASLESGLRRFPDADLDRLSRHLGHSKRTLQRLLSREGVAFHAVRTRVRLEQAETLLADSNTKIAAVARDIGFASTGHFIHWFRKHRGLTPGAWRAGRRPEAPITAMRLETPHE